MNILKELSIGCIRIYQKTFSPDHGRIGLLGAYYGCRYYPSCSEYAIQVIRQYGLLRGSIVSLKRIARCNPWNDGGYDPIPARTFADCNNEQA